MEKPQLSHIFKLSMIAILFLITPLLWPSIRPPYLYFLLNLLILALGAEAGLLSFLQPLDDKKPIFSALKPIEVTARWITAVASPEKEEDIVISNDLPKTMGKKIKRVEKCLSEKIVSVVEVRSLIKLSSTPSIFFIGDGETGETEFEEESGEECLTGPELHTRAETLIGNFYKQLKIQREASWNKIHGLCHSAF